MAKKPPASNKRIQIDKNNASMVLVVAAAAFVTIFSLVASKALLGQRSYQARVITAKKQALQQLKANNQAVTELLASYKTFVSSTENKIGGSATGTGERDGDNARIVLDALPSKYDFPALATSLEKIILSKKTIKVNGITGVDDEINQSTQTDQEPKPVDMQFQVSITANFDTIQSISEAFERSIRPIKVGKMTFSGNDSNLTAVIEGRTYYQPEKTVKITTKVIK